MGNKILDFLIPPLVLRKDALSPTLLGLCIDELKQMIVKFINEERIEEVVIWNVQLSCFCCMQMMWYFLHTLGDAKKLMRALEDFCMHEIMSMERVVEYMLKVQKSPLHQLLGIAWKQEKRSKRHIKAKFCV